LVAGIGELPILLLEVPGGPGEFLLSLLALGDVAQEGSEDSLAF